MVQFISLKDIQDELFLCKDHFIFQPKNGCWARMQRVENIRQVAMEFIIVNGVYCLADSKMVE